MPLETFFPSITESEFSTLLKVRLIKFMDGWVLAHTLFSRNTPFLRLLIHQI